MNHCLCHSTDTIQLNSEKSIVDAQNLTTLADMSKNIAGAKYPLLTCKNNDLELTFLVDTGADKSIINKGSLVSIEHKECGGKAIIMTGSSDVIATNCTIKLATSLYEGEEEFRVLNIGSQCCQLSTMTGKWISGVIGMDYLMKHNIILDFKNNKIYAA